MLVQCLGDGAATQARHREGVTDRRLQTLAESGESTSVVEMPSKLYIDTAIITPTFAQSCLIEVSAFKGVSPDITLGGNDNMISGIVAGLISAGLIRAVSAPFAKITRLKRIERSYANALRTNGAVRQAFADFESVFSKTNQPITEELAHFFQELERSGLITVIAEEAVLNMPSRATREAFRNLYSIHLREEDDKSNEIYDALFRVISVSVPALLDNPALQFLIETAHKHVQSKLADINNSIALYLRERKRPSIGDIKDATVKIAKAVQAQNRNIRVETNKGLRKIDIKRLFIASKLQTNRFDTTLKKLSSFYIRKDRRHRDPYFDLFDPPRDPSEVSYAQFRSSFLRAVVLGDPGGGKSTLCQNLCYELAIQCASTLQFGSELHTEPELNKLPLRVILRSFEKARNVAPQVTIFDFIVQELRNITNLNTPEIEAAVSYNLSYGSAVVAFDGLDEILDTSKRREFADLVAAFCDLYPLCPILVTSRMVGYEDAPLPDDFHDFTLKQFDNSEVSGFVSNLLKVIQGSEAKPKQLSKQVKQFVAQTEHTASDIRCNPLMLGLMTWLYYMKGDVPSNRPEIYKECAILMFEKWDQKRGILANIPGDFDLLHLFSELAAHIYGDPGKEEGVSKEWLEQRVRAFFRYLYQDESRALQSARLILEFVTGRSWVMSEIGDDVFKFTHRTFLEFFFARHIDEQYDSVAEVFAQLKPHIERQEWDVVCHLALQLKSFRNQRRVKEAIDVLRTFISGRATNKQKEINVRFAAKALEYLPGPEIDVAALIKDIFDSCLVLASRRNPSPIECLQFIPSTSIERRDCALETLSTLVVEQFQKRSVPQRDLLAMAVSSPTGWRHTSQLYSVFPANVTARLRERLRPTITSQSASDRFIALLQVDWYRSAQRATIRRFGPQLLLSDQRVARRRRQPDHFMELVLFAIGRNSLGRYQPGESDIELIEAISEFWSNMGPYHMNTAEIEHVEAIVPPDTVLIEWFSNKRIAPKVFLGGVFCIMVLVEISEHLIIKYPKGYCLRSRGHFRKTSFLTELCKMFDRLGSKEKADFLEWTMNKKSIFRAA